MHSRWGLILFLLIVIIASSKAVFLLSFLFPVPPAPKPPEITSLNAGQEFHRNNPYLQILRQQSPKYPHCDKKWRQIPPTTTPPAVRYCFETDEHPANGGGGLSSASCKSWFLKGESQQPCEDHASAINKTLGNLESEKSVPSYLIQT